MKVKLSEILDTIKTYYGTITSDDELQKLVIQEVIYKEANLLAVGTQLVGVKTFDDLYVKWAYPSAFTAEYPVPEGAEGGLAEPIQWTEFSLALQKAVVRFEITDEAKIRMLGDYQLQFSRKRAAEALALAKDKNIIQTLLDNAHYTISVANPWDTDTGDPVSDIIDAISWIFDNSNIAAGDIKKMAVVVPAKIWAALSKPIEINNILQTVRSYFEKEYGLRILPSRGSALGKDALVLVPGEMTAIHGVLRTNKIPLTETHRDPRRGVTQYIIRQYFATAVVPDSNRIVRLSGVLS